MEFQFAFTPSGTIVLYMTRTLTEGVLSVHEDYADSDDKMHRTPHEEIEADIFHRLEVEMANDAIVGEAESTTSFNNVVLADRLRQQLTADADSSVINISSPEEYNGYLIFFNSLYTYSRRHDLDDFTVGDAQDDDPEVSRVEPLVANLMHITSILADLGINAARAFEALGEDFSEDDSD